MLVVLLATLAPAQTKISGTSKCDKPEQQQKIDVGDQSRPRLLDYRKQELVASVPGCLCLFHIYLEPIELEPGLLTLAICGARLHDTFPSSFTSRDVAKAK